MTFEFKHIDDFKFILPDWGGNPIEKFTQHFFKDYGLQFALLEIATIKNRTGIGDILLWTSESENAQEIIDTYQDIINGIQKKYKINLPEFHCWYDHFNYSYILNYQNSDVKNNIGYNRYNFNWCPISANKNNYPLIDKNHYLSKNVILNFLNGYGKKIYDKLLFKYPYFSIIIKPISFPNHIKNQHPYEIGTFYLHFATCEHVPTDKYYEFLNNFFIIWVKEYAAILIEEFKKQISNIEEEMEAYCLPPWEHMNGKKKMFHLIKKYIIKIYTTKKDSLEKELFAITKKVILFLLDNDEQHLKDIYYKHKTKGLQDLIKQKNKISQEEFIECFEKIIIQREIFKLLLLGNIAPDKIHNYFSENYISGNKNTSKKGYFWSNRFIPLKYKPTNESEIRVDESLDEIKQSLSSWEKSFIEKYITITKKQSETNPEKALEVIKLLECWSEPNFS
jgi:hypothetical protein